MSKTTKEDGAVSSDKAKALDAIMSSLEKDYGK